MKIKEYKRLAKISLKSRKKTTRSTVRGIAFGLILLAPIIFLAFGINGDLTKKLNANPQLLFGNLKVAAERSNAKDSKFVYDQSTGMQTSTQVFGSEHYAEIEGVVDNSNAVYFEGLQNDRLNYDNNGGSSGGSGYFDTGCKFGFNDDRLARYEINGSDNVLKERSKVAIVDLQKSNNMLTTKALTTAIGDIFVEGCNKGFYGNARGQIILAEEMVETFDLTPAQVYGKKFTWQYQNSSNGNVMLDDDNNPNNILPDNTRGNEFDCYLCYKYEVVGVIKKEVTQKMREIHGNYKILPLNSAMILARTSLVNDNGEILEPVLTLQEDEDQKRQSVIATYTKDAEQLKKQNQQFIMIGANVYSNAFGYKGVNPNTDILFGAESYKDLNNKITDLTQIFKNSFEDGNASLDAKGTFGSETFFSFSIIFTVFQYASLIMISIGGIIFFAAMVNLFNTIMHSVNSRKNYLGVMRAIGAQSKTIPMLYIFETLAIFRRALVWIAIFGGAICIGIKLAIDMAFRRTGAVMGITLSISWVYIILTFLIIMAVLLLFGWLFSYICTKKISRQPITEVLEAN
ncbi:MAG: ABC transporter permease [Clostridia bacterium]